MEIIKTKVIGVCVHTRGTVQCLEGADGNACRHFGLSAWGRGLLTPSG